MPEGAQGIAVTERPIVQDPAVRTEQRPRPEVKFTPDAGLQARLLFATENFQVNPQQISDRLNRNPDTRWDWKTFQAVSGQERLREMNAGRTPTTYEVWRDQFIKWSEDINKNPNQQAQLLEIMTSLGISNLQDSAILEKVRNYANSQDGKGMQDFVAKMANLSNIDSKLSMIKAVACAFYGQEVSSEVVSQIIHLESELAKAKTTPDGVLQLSQRLQDAVSAQTLEPEIFQKIHELRAGADKIAVNVAAEHNVVSAKNENVWVLAQNASAKSEIGARPEQEDYAFAQEGEGLPEDVRGIYVIADGHKGDGAAASKIATTKFVQVIKEKLFRNKSEDIPELLKTAIGQAHSEVVNNIPEGGTTLTAAIWIRDKVYIVNIGDSRAYFLPKGTEPIRQVTADHTIKSGSGEDVLKKAIGNQNKLPYSPEGDDIHVITVATGDYLVLCTDGISKVISSEQIQEAVRGKSSQEAVEALMKAAAAGTDNRTAIVMKIA